MGERILVLALNVTNGAPDEFRDVSLSIETLSLCRRSSKHVSGDAG